MAEPLVNLCTTLTSPPTQDAHRPMEHTLANLEGEHVAFDAGSGERVGIRGGVRIDGSA